MARLLSLLGAGAARHRVSVVVLWLLVLLGGVAGAVTLGGETSNSFSIPGQESTTALDRIAEEFPGTGGASARVVVRAAEGQALTTPQGGAAVAELVATLAALPGVAAATDPLDPAAPTVNPTQTTAYSTVTYSAPVGEVSPAQQEALLDAVADARAEGSLSVEVTGEAVHEPPHVGGPAEVVGVVLALVVLAVAYGSLVVAASTLLTAVVGVGIGVLGITVATGFTDLSSTTPTLAAMLGLAVGIDYALFIVTRFQQELRSGADVHSAVATATATAGSAVVTAGLTVVIALAGLFVAGIPFLTQMGLAAAATIVVAVLVALTLVPAVLALLGRRALPRRDRAAATRPSTDGGRGVLGGWAGTVTRRPVAALLLSVLVLGAIAIPSSSMRTTLVPTPADDSTQAAAEQLLAEGFGPGINGPLTVLFDGPGAVAAAGRASGPVGELDGVAVVTPPVPAPDGSAALLTVLPQSGPTSPATERLVGDLRDLLDGVDGPGADGTSTAVTGATAVSVDVAASLEDALPVYLALVVGLALVLLVLVFRSLLVPVVGVLGFLLTVGAALGATVAVFSWGWLGAAVGLESAGPLISLAPILVIGILFGLAMDYQVFLVSRMHEAHRTGAAPLDAIRTGFRQAAPVVVAAALIMFAVFAGFVPAGDATLKSIAFALAAGILFDAFVVRMVLVPAALTLLGERAWWLPQSLQWLPVLDVEGAGLEPLVRRELADAPSR